MTRPDDPLLSLAADVADGEAIDWDDPLGDGHRDVERSGDAATLDLVAGLRRLEHLRGLFRLADGGAKEDTPSTWRWGHLQVGELLGSGSFGVVYSAYDPVLRRQVALKLRSTPPGSGEEGTFLAEARRLARVRHPNVLAVHGADVHAGRVGLWADLLEGRTLEQLVASGEPVPAADALTAALQLAEALEAVHGAGLVHGDVKAANVMLENDGRAVLMDFGAGSDVFATAGSSRSDDAVIGSPLSMAPELFQRAAPSFASDLYAAGVLFFRLLTGRYPFEAETLEQLEARHRSRNAAPLHLLKRVPRAWRPLLQALLSPEPMSRPTAGELVAALRELAALPDRRRRQVALVAVILSLLAALGGSSAGWLSAKRSAERADIARVEAEATSSFLTDLLLAPDITEQGPGVRVLDVMDEARSLAEDTLSDRDLIRGRILWLIGRVRASLGESEEALEILSQAEAALAAAPETAALEDGVLVAVRRARLLVELGRLGDAEAELDRLEPRLSDLQQTDGAHRVWLRTKAYLDTERGDLSAAEEHYRQALLLTDSAPQTELHALRSDLAIVLETSGRLDEAEALYRQNLAMSLQRHGERHDNTLVVRHNLAGLLAQLGRLTEAEGLFRINVETAEAWLGPGHRIHLSSLAGLTNVLTDQGRLKEAGALDEQAFPLAEEAWGEDHPRTQILRMNAANRRLLAGHHVEAEALLRLAIEHLSRRLGPGAPPLLYAETLLAQVLVDTGRAHEALPLAEDALERAREGLGSDSPITLGLETRLGRVLTALGRSEDSLSLLTSTLDRHREMLGRDAAEALLAQIALAEAELAAGRRERAHSRFCDAAERFERTLGSEHPHTRLALGRVGSGDPCPGEQ